MIEFITLWRVQGEAVVHLRWTFLQHEMWSFKLFRLVTTGFKQASIGCESMLFLEPVIIFLSWRKVDLMYLSSQDKGIYV